MNGHSRVVIVGQGYVGLPLAKAAVAAGHHVVGFDIDADKVADLRMGRSPIDDVTDGDIRHMRDTGRYRPSDAPADLDGFDVALVTVPTPLRDCRPDLSAVLAAADQLSRHVSRDALVVLESTVAPGTTAGEFAQALSANAAGLVPGRDFRLAFSPERIDPGNPRWHFANTPKLVGGIDRASTEAAVAFYRSMCETVHPCPDAATAEMAKLLENTYRQVNIALINELSRHANALGVDIWRVVDAAATKPYGFAPFYPGPGVGGHCLPVDPMYLSDRIERTLGEPFAFVDLATRINGSQPAYVAERIVKLLNDRRLPVRGSRILLLGLAYKANSSDVREAPAAQVIESLRRLGGQVLVADPKVRDLAGLVVSTWPDVKPVQESEVYVAAREADLTVLLTGHNDFDYPAIAAAAGLVLDTRNRMAAASHVHVL